MLHQQCVDVVSVLCVDVSVLCVDVSVLCVDVSVLCVDVSVLCVDVSVLCVDVSVLCVDVSVLLQQLMQELEIERERRWKAEQATRKLADHIRQLQDRGNITY